jgi:predicted dehydrogenase
MKKVSVALVGGGAIGRMHADVIVQSDCATLAAIVDPAPQAVELAERHGVPSFTDPVAMIDATAPEAAIIATPNATHLPIARLFVERGIPAIVEKPIADTVEDGEALTRASETTGVPVLVGHHRRYNPIIRKARDLIQGGALGHLTNVTVVSTVYKDASYFDAEWRRMAGAGPVLINLIHEIDLIRFVCGEIASVQAITSHSVRGFEVEDTAAILLRLVDGGLVTVSLSDTAVSPWSWDLSAGELPSYPPQHTPVSSHFFSGTEASLSLPTLELWRYTSEKSWFAPLSREVVEVQRASPYVEQLVHLCRVVRGYDKPLITAADATMTLRATLAVHEAARTGGVVTLN